MRNGEKVMKNMKYSVLLVITLVGMMLFNACDTPENNTQIENGYGKVSISLTGDVTVQESIRTVLPSTTAFTRYVYFFYKSGSTSGTVKTPDKGYFNLELGSYTVTVDAYIGTAGYTLAATGTSSQFSVEQGNNTKVVVRLSSVTTGTQGQFRYTITCPQGATATITLQKWQGSNITLNPGYLSQTLNLDTGSYMLTVTISNGIKKAGKSEAIHIYPSTLTEYKKDFTNDDFVVSFPNSIETLISGVWASGNFSSTGDEQWFKFTATASTNYIYASFGTLIGLSVQLYDSTGTVVGNQASLSSSNNYISRSLTSGQTYYIKVTPNYSAYTGTYQIAFNTSGTTPSPTITLNAGVWADGTVSSTGEQWYKFTATASTHYIHVTFGTLNSSYGLNAQVYNSSFNTVGSLTTLYNSNRYTYLSSLTSGQTYYIKVTPYNSSYTGTYQITFNTSSTPPPATITLNAGLWADGTVSSSGEQWYKFTATASTNYIHASFGTLSSSNGVNVQMYNSSGSTVGDQTRLYSSNLSTSRTLTSGQTYYIKVTPYSSSYSGTYQIAFNSSGATPSPTITLIAGVWADGTISSTGEQWYKFTATASTNYIHVSIGGLNSPNGVNVQMYNSSGATVGPQTTLSNNSTSLSVTSGQTYYIKVTPYSSYTGTYKIAFSTSSTVPSTTITLNAGAWADGTVSSYGEQWFKFIATLNTHYIHVNIGTLNDFYVQVYDSNGSTVGSQTEFYSSSTKYTSRSVTSGQTYYIKVTPYSGYSGTYQIAFSTSSTTPSP